MNKLLAAGFVLCLTLGLSIESLAQPAYRRVTEEYYYYPTANVYYSPVRKNYVYLRGGAWITVNVLPPTIVIGSAPRYVVYHEGPNVWVHNKRHIRDCHPHHYHGRPDRRDRAHDHHHHPGKGHGHGKPHKHGRH